MKLVITTLIPAFVIGLIGANSCHAFQDQDDERIEIVNQDGEQVELKIRRSKQGGDVQIGKNKITIIDSAGNKREIDVNGAQNIIVNKSVQSVIKDGEKQRKFVGKAIIVGPDGERQEIELGDDMELPMIGKLGGKGFEFFGPGARLPGNMIFGKAADFGKFMIGVNCKPVSDELRAHLDLTQDVGLAVVGDPLDDSPAGNAGVKQHDILMYADQQELSTIEDLVEAVQLAGKEDRDLTLTMLRKGKEIAIDVRPTERKQMAWAAGMPGFNVDIEEVGPGFLFDKDDEELSVQVLKRMEQLDKEIQDRMKEFSKIREQLEREFSDPVEEDDD